MSDLETKDTTDNPQNQWVVLKCPSCEKKIKIPKEKLGSAKFQCPHCSKKITVVAETAERTGESVEAGAGNEHHSIRTEAGSPLLETISPPDYDEDEQEDFLSRIKPTAADLNVDEIDVLDKDGKQVVKRRRRVRKKKKVDQDPDWESGEAENEIQEEDLPDDEQFVVVGSEIDEDGNVVERRRRIKTGRKKTFYEKFSANMAKAFWVFTIITLIGLGGALVFLTQTSKDAKHGEEKLVLRDTGEIDAEITAEAFAVIEQYLTVSTWTERVQLVRNPVTVRPLMEAFYEQQVVKKREGAFIPEGADGQSFARRERVVRSELGDELDMIFIAVAFPPGDYQYFALERKKIPGTDDSYEYLIDWEVTERYRPIPIEDFKAKAELGSVAEFRVTMQGQGTFFILPYDSAEDWRCYRLTYPGDPDFELFGYTKKGTPIDAAVLDLFQYDGIPSPILKVAYPPKKIYDRVAVEIVEILHTTWFK